MSLKIPLLSAILLGFFEENRPFLKVLVAPRGSSRSALVLKINHSL